MRKLKFIIAFCLAALTFTAAGAQEKKAPEGYVYVDSVIYVRTATADSTLLGRSIFSVLPSKAKGNRANVNVHQSSEIRSAMESHISSNAERHINGYRIRIFFDNKQNARAESEAALRKFTAKYHDMNAYRSYANPYFKVTVGDFRTKTEAMQVMKRVVADFPAAFIVKENINFPIVNKEHSYRTDTIKVLRPINPQQNKQ